MSAIKRKKATLVFPSDTPMTNSELVKVTKDAEKGPFYTSTEVKQALKQWRKSTPGTPLRFDNFQKSCQISPAR